MNTKLQKIYVQICSVSVFHQVTEHALFQAFEEYCLCAEGELCKKMKAYAKFVAEIYKSGTSLTEFVSRLVFEDENVYIKNRAKNKEVEAHVVKSARRELQIFSDFAALTADDFAEDMDVAKTDIAQFGSFIKAMGSAYEERVAKIDKYGYGIFASYGMFRVSDDKKIEAIVSADKIGMQSFIGYEEERGKVVENTLAFVEGRPAANTLLCGDAGTGKSSTVKAVANEFFEKGVRLIELRKDQLSLLPYVMGKISENPLKFIIFIDDLAFNRSDDNFSMLKAALEGSASAKADNAVIYATSNRRHIIKESFADRDGDDVHVNDTMQETLSLSERFGLVVLYSKPNKKLYLDIVHSLAKQYKIRLKEEELDVQAEAFALKKGNRSARCAQQFIESLLR